MAPSDSYLAAERLIQTDEISLSALERLLDSLEDQQLITTDEHEALLELAWKVHTDHPSPP